jgi:hypothetical protein
MTLYLLMLKLISLLSSIDYNLLKTVTQFLNNCSDYNHLCLLQYTSFYHKDTG